MPVNRDKNKEISMKDSFMTKEFKDLLKRLAKPCKSPSWPAYTSNTKKKDWNKDVLMIKIQIKGLL